MTCSFWSSTAASRTMVRMSLLPIPGTAGFANIPSARCRRPSWCSLASTARSSVVAGSQPRRGARITPRDELLVRVQLDALRAVLPPTFRDYAAVGLGEAPFELIDQVVPPLRRYCSEPERTALLRRSTSLPINPRPGGWFASSVNTAGPSGTV